MHIYCITHKNLDFIEKLNLIPSGVGSISYPQNFIDEKTGNNINQKNPYYGEITFHYWLWKNKLKDFSKNDWFGVCHYRRFFLKNKFSKKIQNSNNQQGFFKNELSLNEIKSMIIEKPENSWKDLDVILCEPIDLRNQKKTKIIKKAFRSFIKKPSILFNGKKHNIRLHFEMFHGHKYLDSAINLLPEDDKLDFQNYINHKTSLSPNCMYISNNKEKVEKFYLNLFTWLENCEKVFGLKKTNDYGTQRIYTFLTERYLPFWFEKYCRVGYSPWIFYDLSK